MNSSSTVLSSTSLCPQKVSMDQETKSLNLAGDLTILVRVRFMGTGSCTASGTGSGVVYWVQDQVHLQGLFPS